MKIISDWLTGIDQKTHDPARGLWALGVLTFLGLSIYSATKFDPQAFGIGFGSVLAGGALGVKLKAETEPRREKE